MNGYKEFEGKTLDDAIRDACSFYDTGRDKLEIEILNDSKGGIFGLVGAKKARIRARMVELSSVLEGLDSPAGGKGRQQKKRGEGREERQPARQESQNAGAQSNEKREGRTSGGRRERGESKRQPAPVVPTLPTMEETGYIGQESVAELFAKTSVTKNQPSDDEQPAARSARPAQRPRRQRSENGRDQSRARQAESADVLPVDDMEGEDLERVSFDQLDAAELEAAAREIVATLTGSFLENPTITVTIGTDRVRVSITDVEDPGLLIGRDGQTLASLQYLVTRMLSNRMKALLRVQIDAGDYRERQDERLRELALSLAEKVKAGGRPQVTRPLSSYHRRVIHLTLQDDPLIQTHSKGEGEMKRVMVARKKQGAA